MKKVNPNSISFKNKSIEKLTAGQKYIASQAGDPNKIEQIDFKMLRKKNK